ncbi:MAG: hypothetical protein FJ276_23845 [Planctomycetes bacterium]|nr:hypothetical protein [Planctomycetota bacterium]
MVPASRWHTARRVRDGFKVCSAWGATRVLPTFAVLACVFGCGHDDAIRHYKVPKRSWYQLPPGWAREERDAFSQLALGVRDGERKARITVSMLGGSGGGLLANVNRWRGQVGLEPLSEEASGDAFEAFEIPGCSGHYVECESSEEAESAKAIYGWIGALPDRSWFIKMHGDRVLVRRERTAFRDFLKSLDLVAADGAGHGNAE